MMMNPSLLMAFVLFRAKVYIHSDITSADCETESRQTVNMSSLNHPMIYNVLSNPTKVYTRPVHNFWESLDRVELFIYPFQRGRI